MNCLTYYIFCFILWFYSIRQMGEIWTLCIIVCVNNCVLILIHVLKNGSFFIIDLIKIILIIYLHFFTCLINTAKVTEANYRCQNSLLMTRLHPALYIHHYWSLTGETTTEIREIIVKMRVTLYSLGFTHRNYWLDATLYFIKFINYTFCSKLM